MKPITIIDAICGAGKTQYAIQMINKSEHYEKFIYITPFLNEVQRIKKYTNRSFVEPNQGIGQGRKYEHFKELVIEGKNIISTHKLFSQLDPSILDSIKYNNYTLILDEVINVLDYTKLTINDWDHLITKKEIKIEEKTNKIIWINPEYKGRFWDIMELAEGNNLYLHTRTSETKSKILLVWTFPIEVFSSFKEIYNLTYMFDGQLQKYYFDMYNREYIYKSVKLDNISKEYYLVDYDKKTDNREIYKSLINIYCGHLNNIGEEYNSLSKSWLTKNLKNGNIKILKNNMLNWYKNIAKTKSKYNLWTTYKGSEKTDSGKQTKDLIKIALSGAGYQSGFLSCNARATNLYNDRTSCCYALNRFLNPIDKGFFEDKNVKINEESYSISELIQWLFRSAIREKECINLYIPSSRMRNLLEKWINYEL